MYKAFEIAGYPQEQLETEFAGMLGALKFGAPPHGGSAPGRPVVMLLADEPNIREVILFPMNQQAQDLMMNTRAGRRRTAERAVIAGGAPLAPKQKIDGANQLRAMIWRISSNFGTKAIRCPLRSESVLPSEMRVKLGWMYCWSRRNKEPMRLRPLDATGLQRLAARWRKKSNCLNPLWFARSSAPHTLMKKPPIGRLFCWSF